VIPAFASRVIAFKAGELPFVPVGNVDVRRDFLDVRDVVRAYRLLLESAHQRLVTGPRVVNVASGRSTKLGEILHRLACIANVELKVEQDPSLVRAGEVADVRGDPSLLTQITGWKPEMALTQTLSDVLADRQRARDSER
jgi:GDP-4-dehydro-6-deoxy-D-mannose reductase